MAKVSVVLGPLTVPGSAGTTGICLGNALTKTTATNGSYCMTWDVVQATDSSYSERPTEASIKAYWYTKTAWAAFTSSVWTTTGGIDLSSKTYYDQTLSPEWTVDAEEGVFVDEAVIWMSFYMPSEPAIDPLQPDAEAAATTDYGDRLNVDDSVQVIGIPIGGASTMVSCGAPNVLALGSEYLAAGASLITMAGFLF